MIKNQFYGRYPNFLNIVKFETKVENINYLGLKL